MTIVSTIDDADDARIVAEGKALADAFGEELHVVHVQDREEIEESVGKHGKRTAREEAAATAATVAETVTDEFEAIGLLGNPAAEIDSYVDEVDARYLVVGGRKRTPIGKALFGSVTQSVLLSVDTPVVTVRTGDT
ncbi:universal stress protein [Halorubrum sp. DTA98]|uniref:universal stress protein n=1 Tax=Halorubrum sp. DTA98 TaxID=3402163 RepID=UPI003AAE3B33